MNGCRRTFDHSNWRSVNEVAEILGLCTRTIYREIKQGNLRCLRFGRAIRITDSQLDEFLKSREG